MPFAWRIPKPSANRPSAGPASRADAAQRHLGGHVMRRPAEVRTTDRKQPYPSAFRSRRRTGYLELRNRSPQTRNQAKSVWRFSGSGVPLMQRTRRVNSSAGHQKFEAVEREVLGKV